MGSESDRTNARTLAREAALQMLYAFEAGPNSVEQVIAAFWRETPADPEAKEYADELVRGVAGELPEIDEAVRSASQNWRLERMARVDRNVLRLATFELKSAQIPRSVAIDEAVSLAKKFGTEESGKFVNGVLTKVADDLGRVDLDR